MGLLDHPGQAWPRPLCNRNRGCLRAAQLPRERKGLLFPAIISLNPSLRQDALPPLGMSSVYGKGQGCPSAKRNISSGQRSVTFPTPTKRYLNNKDMYYLCKVRGWVEIRTTIIALIPRLSYIFSLEGVLFFRFVPS